MMSEFMIDKFGAQYWYDLKSNRRDDSRNISHGVTKSDNSLVYVRPHREDGPAIIWEYGVEIYYIEGKRHREDGPTIIFLNGVVYWYLNDIEYSFKEWCKELNKSEEEINFFRLMWGI